MAQVDFIPIRNGELGRVEGGDGDVDRAIRTKKLGLRTERDIRARDRSDIQLAGFIIEHIRVRDDEFGRRESSDRDCGYTRAELCLCAE